MKRRLAVSVLAVFCLLSPCSALARIWTDSSGTHKVDAELVKLDGEVVHLKKADGTIAKVPLDKLCSDDREFVRQQFAAKAGAASPQAESEVGAGNGAETGSLDPEAEFQKIVTAVKKRADKPTGVLTYMPPSRTGAYFLTAKWIREENEFKVEKATVTKSETNPGTYEAIIVVSRRIIIYLSPKKNDGAVSDNAPNRWFDSEAEAMQATKSMIEDSPSIKEMDERHLTIRYAWKNGRWSKEDGPMLCYPYSDQLSNLVGFKQISRNTYRRPLSEGEKASEAQYLPIKKVYDVSRRPGVREIGGGAAEKKVDPLVATVLHVTSEKYRERGYGGFRFGMSAEDVSRLLSTEGLKPIRLPPAPLDPASSKSLVSTVIVTQVMREDGSQAFYFDEKHRLISIEQVYTTDPDKHLGNLLGLLGKPARSDIDNYRFSDHGGDGGESPEPNTPPPDVPVAWRRNEVRFRYSFPSAIVHIQSQANTEASNRGRVSNDTFVKTSVFDREYALTQFTRDVSEKRKIFDWLRKVIGIVIQDRATIRQVPAFPGIRLQFQQPSKGVQGFTWRSLDGEVLTVTKYSVAVEDSPKGTVEIRLSLNNLPGRWTNPACLPSLFIMEGVRADVLLAEEVFSPDASGIGVRNDGNTFGNQYRWQTADRWEVIVTSGESLFRRIGLGDKTKR